MRADHSHEIEDEVLRRAVAELRRPVALDPEVDAAALRTITEERRLHSMTSSGHRSVSHRVRWAAVALAAGIAALLLLHQSARPSAAGRRSVELHLIAPASSHVVVVGDFNNWDPSATPLRRSGARGVWTVELKLQPGRYQYSFLLDGREWVRDPTEPPVPASDFGAPVSVLTVS